MNLGKVGKPGFNVLFSGHKGKSAVELAGMKPSFNVLLSGHQGKTTVELAGMQKAGINFLN